MTQKLFIILHLWDFLFNIYGQKAVDFQKQAIGYSNEIWHS
jgi:hypothetical protein